MQAVPEEHSHVPKPHTAGIKTHMGHGKAIRNTKGEKTKTITPLSRVRRTAAGILCVMMNQNALQLIMHQA